MLKHCPSQGSISRGGYYSTTSTVSSVLDAGTESSSSASSSGVSSCRRGEWESNSNFVNSFSEESHLSEDSQTRSCSRREESNPKFLNSFSEDSQTCSRREESNSDFSRVFSVALSPDGLSGASSGDDSVFHFPETEIRSLPKNAENVSGLTLGVGPDFRGQIRSLTERQSDHSVFLAMPDAIPNSDRIYSQVHERTYENVPSSPPPLAGGLPDILDAAMLLGNGFSSTALLGFDGPQKCERHCQCGGSKTSSANSSPITPTAPILGSGRNSGSSRSSLLKRPRPHGFFSVLTGGRFDHKNMVTFRRKVGPAAAAQNGGTSVQELPPNSSSSLPNHDANHDICKNCTCFLDPVEMILTNSNQASSTNSQFPNSQAHAPDLHQSRNFLSFGNVNPAFVSDTDIGNTDSSGSRNPIYQNGPTPSMGLSGGRNKLNLRIDTPSQNVLPCHVHESYNAGAAPSLRGKREFGCSSPPPSPDRSSTEKKEAKKRTVLVALIVILLVAVLVIILTNALVMYFVLIKNNNKQPSDAAKASFNISMKRIKVMEEFETVTQPPFQESSNQRTFEPKLITADSHSSLTALRLENSGHQSTTMGPKIGGKDLSVISPEPSYMPWTQSFWRQSTSSTTKVTIKFDDFTNSESLNSAENPVHSNSISHSWSRKFTTAQNSQTTVSSTVQPTANNFASHSQLSTVTFDPMPSSTFTSPEISTFTKPFVIPKTVQIITGSPYHPFLPESSTFIPTQKSSISEISVTEKLDKDLKSESISAILPSTTFLPLLSYPENTKCQENQFRCTSGVSRLPCLYPWERCDGITDCSDGSDEEFCDILQCYGNFKCNDGRCVSLAKVCNGLADCADESDEQKCEDFQCKSYEYRCPSGYCIPKQWVCDGEADCPGHEEEFNCSTTCSGEKFMCSEGWCIPNSWKCNGIQDCTGGEDEIDCACSTTDFKCSSGGCISQDVVCDGVKNCNDGSDEWNCISLNREGSLLLRKGHELQFSAVCADDWTTDLGDKFCSSFGLRASRVNSFPAISGSQELYGFTKALSTLTSFNPVYAAAKKSSAGCTSKTTVSLACAEYTCGVWDEVKIQRHRRSASPRNQDGSLHIKTLHLQSPNNPTEDAKSRIRLSRSRSRRRKRVVGGHYSASHEWPSVGILYHHAKKWACTASIIAPGWVLTSALCVRRTDPLPFDWKFLAGSAEPSSPSADSVVARKVLKFVIHPSYKFQTLLADFDVALVQLDSPLPFSEAVTAICLPQERTEEGSWCVSAGWGYVMPGGFYVNKALRHIDLGVWNSDGCNATANYNGALTDRMLCAGAQSAKSGPCFNDEGSPLMCRHPQSQRWYLAGVLTSQSCGSFRPHPSVFADTFALRDWISNTVGFLSR